MKRLLTKALIVAAVTLGVLSAGTSPALAMELSSAPNAHSALANPAHGTAAATVVRTVADPGQVGNHYTNYLATERWRSASAQFHGRYDQFLQTDIITASNRVVTQQAAMGIGNGLYSFSQGMLTLALDMEPLNLLGAKVDKSAADIGKALFGSGGGSSGSIVGIVAILVIASTVFSLRRAGQKPWRKILTLAGIIALFALMIAGASASTTDTKGDFKPGFFSPGWFATKISDTVTEVASVPAQSFLKLTPGGSGLAAAPKTSCSKYMGSLNHLYSSNGGPATPQIISSLWESSGLIIFKQTQYGTAPYSSTTGATHGDDVFCHQLDWQANIPAKAQAAVTFGGAVEAKRTGYEEKSMAWGADNNDDRDRSLVAWAACKVGKNGGMTVRPGFPKIEEYHCIDWWTKDKVPKEFNIGGGETDVKGNVDTEAAKRFVLTMHGNDVNSGLILVWTYVISAFLVMFVFAGLGLAVAVAKIAALVMMLASFFVLVVSVVSGNTNKLMGFLKTYMGFTVLAFGATIILSIISLISNLVSKIGVTMFGAGELMSILWTGLSPVLAAVLLHMIFTKMLKMPSVFKPSSAMAWGAAGGAIGGVAGGALMQRGERRAGRMARNLARGAARKAGGSALGKVKDGLDARKKRRGQMVPQPKTGPKTAAGAPQNGPAGTGTRSKAGGRAAGGGTGPSDAPTTERVMETADAALVVADIKKKKDLDQVRLDKNVTRDARRFAKGIDPNKMPEGRLNRAAFIAGGNVRHLRGKVARSRGLVADVSSEGGRAAARDFASAPEGSRRASLNLDSSQAAVIAAKRSVATANASFLKRRTFGLTGGGGGLRDNFHNNLGQDSDFLHKAGTNAKVRAGVAAAAKIGRGVAVGAVLGGPLGAAIGGIAGAKGAYRTVRREVVKSDAQKVLAYAAHREQQAAESAREPEPAGPAHRQGDPAVEQPKQPPAVEQPKQPPAVEQPAPQPVQSPAEIAERRRLALLAERYGSPNPHAVPQEPTRYTPEQWAEADRQTEQRDREIIDRANAENREIAEINRAHAQRLQAERDRQAEAQQQAQQAQALAQAQAQQAQARAERQRQADARPVADPFSTQPPRVPPVQKRVIAGTPKPPKG